MKKNLFSTILILTGLAFNSLIYAQSKEEKLEAIEKYRESEKLLKQIPNLIQSDKMQEAEKLYLKAFSVYPNYNYIHDLPNAKISQGDIKGANRLWEAVIDAFKMYPTVLTKSKESFDLPYLYKFFDTKSYLSHVYLNRAIINANRGDIQIALKDYKDLQLLIPFEAKHFLELSIFANEAGDFETSGRCVDSLKKIYLGKDKLYLSMQLQPIYAEAALYMAKGDYVKVLPLAERLIAEDKGLNTTWKGYGYLLKAEALANTGDLANAKISYDLALKRTDFYASANNATYIKGLIFLLEKDYPNAITSFTKELTFKNIPSSTSYFPDIKTKYRYYTKRAEAYSAAGNYVKAKSDFEAALLYNPNFEPAVNGIVKLENRVITDRKIDKVGPEIVITEPSSNRGLKITSAGNEIMIKGKAIDPSGLKSVTLNGIVIYSQEDGAFWGMIPFKEGNNSVEIEATDIAGNLSSYTLQIEKEASPQIVNEIEPVKVIGGRNFALIVAAQNYDDSTIPSLENPVSDGIRLKLILKNNYNFADENLFMLLNPEISDFKKKFLEINEAIQPEDNLIIFYAGHGIWVDKEKKGYWLLTDALRNDPNTWLSNKVVLDLISKVPSRHTLLITDACFSGSVFKTRSIDADAPPAIREMSEKISRVAITSGNDTEVPDESVFMKYLIKALSENKEKYLTAQKMFINQIIEAVMTESKTEPRYGTLELAGHVGGDYIFMKK